MTCKECGAKVPRKNKHKHKRWHRGLDLYVGIDDDLIDRISERLVGDDGYLVGPPGVPGPAAPPCPCLNPLGKGNPEPTITIKHPFVGGGWPRYPQGPAWWSSTINPDYKPKKAKDPED